MLNGSKKEFASTKARHRNKFERLLDKKKNTETHLSDEKRAKLVINLSHTTLDSHQLSVLSKGLNFAVKFDDSQGLVLFSRTSKALWKTCCIN